MPNSVSVETHQEQIENLESKISKLEEDNSVIYELRYKLKHREEILSDKDEQLENYRIAVGILIAVMAFYVALTVAI